MENILFDIYGNKYTLHSGKIYTTTNKNGFGNVAAYIPHSGGGSKTL